MTIVDLVFPVLGQRVPAQHGYLLYASMSRVLPSLHDGSVDFTLGAITGRYTGRGELQLEARSSILRLRTSSDSLRKVLPLAGKALNVAGNTVRLGPPHVEQLNPVSSLISHFVTIKNANEADEFLVSSRKKLDELGVAGTISVPKLEHGPYAGKHRRRVMRIKGLALVGFAMEVTDLTPEDSLKVQAATNFSRRRMGAAFFLPMEGTT